MDGRPIVVKAYDDLQIETDSATVTVTLGAPCADASVCAKGQQCQAGKCFWPPPTGNLGDSCTFDQFCVSDKCIMTTDGSVCTQQCLLGVSDVCPTGFDCVMANDPNYGDCVKPAKAGCCSANDEGALAHFGLTVGVLAFVMRRRRRSS